MAASASSANPRLLVASCSFFALSPLTDGEAGEYHGVPRADIHIMQEIDVGQQPLTDDDMATIAHDLCPDGRTWVTPYVAVAAGPTMNGVEIEAEATDDERTIVLRFTVDGADGTPQQYVVVGVYMDAKPQRRSEQTQALETMLFSINGALTPSWEILCSVFQGCPLAPTLYAIAAEPEGRRQVVDVKVTGLRTPCGRELLAVMFADDTQNLVTMATIHNMLNNNTLWCLASGGGTQEIKQALQLRGRRRAVADGQPWSAATTVNADATWMPDGDSVRRSRVTQTGVLEHVVALGAQVRPMTVETALDAPEDPEPEKDGAETWTFNPKVRLFPTRAELEAHALQETWGPIAQSVLMKLRLVSQHGLSLLARGQVCATIALSRCWYEASFNPPPDGCKQWKVIRAAAAMFFFTNGVAGLTVDGGRATAKFNHHIAWKQMAAHRHDAGFNFRDPTETVNAIAVRRMLDLLAPDDANSREPALARWTAIPLHWMCIALQPDGYEPTMPDHAKVATIVDLSTSAERQRWADALRWMQEQRIPYRWQRTVRCWMAILPHMEVAQPATHEQAASCLTCHVGYKADERRRFTQQRTAPWAAGEWALTHQAPEGHRERSDHNATGERHPRLGYLLHLTGPAMWRDEITGRDKMRPYCWAVDIYLLTCNGWVLNNASGSINEAFLERATIEPVPVVVKRPETVTLVGRTDDVWAAGRHRLTWKPAGGASRGETCRHRQEVLHASLRILCAPFTGERTDGPKLHVNAVKMRAAMGVEPTHTMKRIIDTVDHAPWHCRLHDYARMLIGGCVKDKAALGRRLADGTADIRCLLCCPAEVGKARRPAVDEPVHIMRDCTALKRLRDWVRKLLTVLTGAADDVRTDAQVARVLVYGRYEKDSPVATAVRGAALDAIRTVRNRQIGEHLNAAEAAPITDDAVVDLATAKLEEHVRQDMAAALDERDGAHNRGSIDGRAKATRPKSIAELNSRWRGVATCDGRALQFALPTDDTATGLDPSGGGAG